MELFLKKKHSGVRLQIYILKIKYMQIYAKLYTIIKTDAIFLYFQEIEIIPYMLILIATLVAC